NLPSLSGGAMRLLARFVLSFVVSMACMAQDGYVVEARFVGRHSLEQGHSAPTVHWKILRSNPRNPLEANGWEPSYAPAAKHLEGKTSGSDCHKPRGSVTRPLIKADSVNQLCYACHSEKRGPFIWEHAPVRKSCSECHLPHGSSHESLLMVRRPFLCQQCHANV